MIGETAEVGDNVTIYQGVTLGGTSLGTASAIRRSATTSIVGVNAAVLGAISIGDDAKVGGGSVVVKDVPPNATVVGIPGARRRCRTASRCVSRAAARGVDMPDPTQTQIEQLAERVAALEARLAELGTRGSRSSPTTMALRLYNTRTRRSNRSRRCATGDVRIYVCGLTPSAEAHLGHARSFMFFDVLRRYLDSSRLSRDVRAERDRHRRPQHRRGARDRRGLARRSSTATTRSFKRSMRRLRVLEPDLEPRATQFIAADRRR